MSQDRRRSGKTSPRYGRRESTLWLARSRPARPPAGNPTADSRSPGCAAGAQGDFIRARTSSKICAEPDLHNGAGRGTGPHGDPDKRTDHPAAARTLSRSRGKAPFACITRCTIVWLVKKFGSPSNSRKRRMPSDQSSGRSSIKTPELTGRNASWGPSKIANRPSSPGSPGDRMRALPCRRNPG